MEYRDSRIAEIYDLINGPGRDTAFYLGLAGAGPLRVLDLGCGTGTLCCALAERGHTVTGADPAAAMLAVARGKPYANRVEWVEASAREFKSRRRFDLIVMTGHAFQVLLNDEEVGGALRTMGGHLAAGGRAAFETRNPRWDWAGEWETSPPVWHQTAAGEVAEKLAVTGRDGEFISFETIYQLRGATLRTHSTLRFPSREQVEELMVRAGLAARAVLGDWEGGPFEAERSREMIFIARRA